MKNSLFMLSVLNLTLFTAGCSDNVDLPTANETLSSTATFNIGLTGMAVKGTMANASISVMKIDETTGESSVVNYRLASSAEPESYSVSAGSGTSVAELEAMIAEEITDNNPSEVTTDADGMFSIYLQNDFSGTVSISVTSDSTIDSNIVRCDSYTGCGAYEDLSSAVSANGDGSVVDLVIDFGEWYKEDLTLTTIKYIPVSDTPDVARDYTANVTVFSEVVATILQDNLTADPVVPISATAISDASIMTVMELLGPDGVINNASLLSDLSTGLGFDLSDIGSDVTLNTGNIALTQLAASLQAVAAAGDNGTLAEIISTLATSISEGTLNDPVAAKALLSNSARANTAAKASSLFNAIQQRVQTIAAIYVAIITGDDAALSDLGVDSAVVTSIATSIETAVANGAITQQEVVSLALEVVALVEEIGCVGDACTIGEDLYADLASQVTADLAVLDSNIANIATSIDDVATAITASSALTVTDVDSAIAYHQSVLATYSMVFDAEGINTLGSAAQGYSNLASAWVSTSEFLVSTNSEYQSLLDTAEATVIAAAAEATQVTGSTGLHADAQALLDDAAAKLTEFDAVVPAAQAVAESSNSMAMMKQGMVETAGATATTSYEAAVGLNDPQSVAAAAAYVAAAEQAYSDELAYIPMAASFLTYAEIALADAQAYAGMAVEDADITAAAALVTSATTMVALAAEHVESAGDNLAALIAMVEDAEAEQVILNKLPMVKATTQSLADINIITTSGRDALADIGEIMFDVLEEANQASGDVTDQASATHTGWMYSFNETNMTIEASHATLGSFQGAAELSNDGSDTTLMFAWAATLNEAGDNGATFEFSAGDLNDCSSTNTTGSCSSFMFTGVFTAISDLDDEDPVSAMSTSSIVIVDGDADFDGDFSITHNNLSTTESPDMFVTEIVIDGMSGEVEFSLTTTIDEDGDDETATLQLMIGDNYTMNGSAINGEAIMGTIWLDSYQYGDFTEVSNGVIATYIDDDEVSYTDLSFTIDE